MRALSLADFDREVAAAGGKVTTVDVAADDDVVDSGENGFDISPELMYTTEPELPALREHIVMEPRSEEPAATANGDTDGDSTRAGDRDDSGAKRRRGRRGGRRGRGGEQNER